MSNYIKYWLFKILNFTFRLIIPAIVAGIVFGLFKPAAEATINDPTWLQRAEIGVFVIIILAFTELKAYLGKLFKQFELDNHIAFLKNNGVYFIVIGLILLAVKLYADRAINFFLLAGASKMIAAFFEYEMNKYYRILYPSKGDITNHKLNMLIDRLASVDDE